MTAQTEQNANKQSLSALDAYLNRVFKLAIPAPSIASATEAIYFTVLKIAGWYPKIPAE